MNIPNFKYHPNPLETGIFKNDYTVICQCCGEKTDIYYDGPFYSVHNVRNFCPKCIVNGKAAEKFNGAFQDAISVGEVSDDSKLDELIHRTPGYCGIQQEYWLAHCDDFCAFIGYIDSWKQLEKMGVAEEIEENHSQINNWMGIEDLKKWLGGSLQGYLFQCLTCKKHFLYVDFD